MADQHSKDFSSNSNVSGESSDSVVELNIKTLDSQIYSFQVNKNMPVSLFKEKIANEIGVPVGQQRLIFRGRVLKDNDPLSEYHVDNGHTLHLVVRQPAQLEPSSDTNPGNSNENHSNQAAGNSTHAGTPQGRVGQISHSVVLGTLNIGDAGEGVIPDLSRVIGSVLNSIGIGSQSMANGFNGFQTSMLASQRDGVANASVSGQGEAGNTGQAGQTSSGQLLRPSPQVVQIPLAAANAFTIPSLQEPIPDSLSTLSEFMSHMEQALSQTGYQLDTSSEATSNQPRVELPTNLRGLPTPAALATILRHAERLLGSHATAALSHLAGRLEQEGTFTDADARAHVQSESARLGLAMQHLGALLLEIGRTILTLRMGQSQVESSVNAGPAVYISSSGPNPIMVQPFPLQTSSLFGGAVPSPNPTPVGPGGMGGVPRHINIHIHAGTPLSSAVTGTASNGDGVQGENRNVNTPSGSGSVRVLPIRNVIAAAVPSRATGLAVPSATQPDAGVPVSQPPNCVSVHPLVSEINAQVRDLVSSIQGGNHDSGVQSEVGQSHTAGGNGRPDSTSGSQADDFTDPSSRVPVQSESSKPEAVGDKEHNEDALNKSSSKDAAACSLGESSSSVDGEISRKPDNGSAYASRPSDKHDSSGDARATPLGLGRGGLERKKRNKQLNSSVKGDTSAPPEWNQNERTMGQQHLQSLFPCRSTADEATTDVSATRHQPSNMTEPRGSEEPLDVSNAMSQVLESPALDGLLAGFSGQTGVGSPDVLRNMLQQFTQNPQIMNTVQQIAQQVDTQELDNMFSGGQGGGFDLSRMVQQMMPVVSRALGQSAATTRPFSAVETRPGSVETEKLDDQAFQKNVQQVARTIEGSDSPGDIFRAIVESSAQLPGNVNAHEDLVDELCGQEDLATEYTEMLRRDISRRLQGDPGPDKR